MTREWSAAFAADLHLSAGDGEGLARAGELLSTCARNAARLFLLGDVFDLWISGDELAMPEFAPLFASFRAAAAAGLRVDFLAGNRDFNFTPAHGAALGVAVAGAEELDVELDGARLRLLHGDQLLLDDVGYQRLKRVLRSAPLRLLARRLPAVVTQALGRRIRRYSSRAVQAKPSLRMRIVPEAVDARFAGGSRVVLCGHVHRLQRLDFGGGRELLVLPPFFESGRFVVLAGGTLREADVSGALRDLPAATPIERGGGASAP